ncbi:MAG: hypothetical protein CMJ42_12385 [Phyllobacteriaceae bacterium]|nr:hypothetical protein [Phyllobacteriaceae bacterium]MBA91728.1 hypothetical protein [Phyllobacteriaceae bacterium]
MAFDDIRVLDMRCNHCGSRNRLTFDHGSDNCRLDCSHCGRTIGYIDAIGRYGLPDGNDAAHALPSWIHGRFRPEAEA